MNKLLKIEINFPVEVDLPDGWEKMLGSMIEMICNRFEKQNPNRLMWVAGHGGKPSWNEPNEPDFDMSVLCIDVSEMDDYYGNNPNNPDRDKLRKEAKASREALKNQTVDEK